MVLESIVVDFVMDFGFRQDNQENFARCDGLTSHLDIAELRTVRHVGFAPCEPEMSHLAKLACYTL